MINKEVIKAYALKNAAEHEGKAIMGSVINSLFNEGLKKDRIKDIIPEINEVLDEINKMSLEEQKKHLSERENLIGHRKTREGLPKLPEAKKGKVIMRFSPAASGPLHIGHFISNMISSLFVKKYGGKFYVRIEDTNPDEVMPACYKSFKEDCDWLFGNVEEYIIQSNRMKIYYKYVEKLMNKNSVYVCTCNKDNFKELLIAKKPCPCRELEKKEQLKRWKKMLDKKGYKEGEAVLRFKSDLNNLNPAMRDFPLARINLTKHPRQGNKYKVWPLMNLAVTIDDIEYKMTHIIRGKDHMDNAKRQRMIYKALGKEKQYPWVFFMGRIKFSDLVLSKRKIAKAISEGKYEGWEDARLPTLASLRKRGYKPEAFAKLAEQRGLTDVDKLISQKDFFDALENSQKFSGPRKP